MVHLIQDIMHTPYVVEKYDDFVKYHNDDFEILKQRTCYVVIDKRITDNRKMYTNLDVAHKYIVRS